MRKITTALGRKQVEHEKYCSDYGVKRFHENLLKRGEAESAAGMALKKAGIEPLSDAITAYVKEGLAGRASRHVSVVRYLDMFDANTIAYLTLHTALSCMQKTDTMVQSAALQLVNKLDTQLSYEKLRKQSPKAFKRMREELKKKGSSTQYRHVIVNRQFKAHGVQRVVWGDQQRLKVGIILLQLCSSATGMIDDKLVWTSKNVSKKFITATEATRLWLNESHARCSLLDPKYTPMYIKPEPWTSGVGGGYITPAMRYPLVKHASDTYTRELADVEMSTVYKSVNALQDTKWQINMEIYNIVNKAWESSVKTPYGGLPAPDDKPVPTPIANARAPENEAKFKAWKIEARKVHEWNARNQSKRAQFQAKMRIAEMFIDGGTFYFPYQLDFRGRCYPVAHGLNPQSDDVAKSLLMFKDGVPLGKEGKKYLAIHGANSFGGDVGKLSFDGRLQWIADNEPNIRASACTPLDHPFWEDADDPFSFLAFAMEWNCMLQGDDHSKFVSHLAVQFDGSQNGACHLNAACRDEVGGALVGLVDTDVPPDLYSKIMGEAELLLSEDDSIMGTKWLGNLKRELVKRPAMTFVYGSLEYGVKNQLLEVFTKLRENNDLPFEAGVEDAAFLAKVINRAIKICISSSWEIMEWLKNTAAITSKNDLPIRWTTAVGFPVLQSYRVKVGKRVDFDIQGTRQLYTLRITGSKLNKVKQSTALAANYTHSQDASHLMSTISLCVDDNMSAFSMIHDSYGVHAGDASKLFVRLREAFVEQYEVDVLEDFREGIVGTLPDNMRDQVAPIPKKGTLDIRGVLKSKYFFA